MLQKNQKKKENQHNSHKYCLISCFNSLRILGVVLTLSILIVISGCASDLSGQALKGVVKTDDDSGGERAGEVTQTIFVHGANLLASKTDSDELQFYIQDHLGSNNVVLDKGNVVQEDEYFAFGEKKSHSGTQNNDFLYTGKELDDSGLYFYGARYYNPDIGRFMAADAVTGSLQDPQSLNRYAYVKNNPLKYIDPVGNSPASVKEVVRPVEVITDETIETWLAKNGKATGSRVSLSSSLASKSGAGSAAVFGFLFLAASAHPTTIQEQASSEGANSLQTKSINGYRVLFRGHKKDKTLEDIFNEGMPAGTDTTITLQQHLDGTPDGHGLKNSPFISTSKNPNRAAGFAIRMMREPGDGGYIYHIVDYSDRTVDPESQGMSRVEAEDEITYVGDIRSEDIIGATRVTYEGEEDFEEVFEFHEFVPNPNFKMPTYRGD